MPQWKRYQTTQPVSTTPHSPVVTTKALKQHKHNYYCLILHATSDKTTWDKLKTRPYFSIVLPPPLFQCCFEDHQICTGKHHGQNNSVPESGGGQFLYMSRGVQLWRWYWKTAGPVSRALSEVDVPILKLKVKQRDMTTEWVTTLKTSAQKEGSHKHVLPVACVGSESTLISCSLARTNRYSPSRSLISSTVTFLRGLPLWPGYGMSSSSPCFRLGDMFGGSSDF